MWHQLRPATTDSRSQDRQQLLPEDSALVSHGHRRQAQMPSNTMFLAATRSQAESFLDLQAQSTATAVAGTLPNWWQQWVGVSWATAESTPNR